jgi:hypothetical protein
MGANRLQMEEIENLAAEFLGKAQDAQSMEDDLFCILYFAFRCGFKTAIGNIRISMSERIQGEIMGILTEEMKRVVTEIQLCYAATVTPDGKPNLSPKGSITVLSDDELGFADLASPGTIGNLRHNPAIEQWRAPPGQ